MAVPELRLVSVPVAGTPLSLLVRPDTVDDYVVREVVKTDRIADLVERYKSQPSVTIVDIGGHIGSFSVIMATLLPQARVQVFEPLAANFEVHQPNVLRHEPHKPKAESRDNHGTGHARDSKHGHRGHRRGLESVAGHGHGGCTRRTSSGPVRHHEKPDAGSGASPSLNRISS